MGVASAALGLEFAHVVHELLHAVWKKAVKRAREEETDIARLITDDGKNHDVMPWDWRFYAERIRAQTHYAVFRTRPGDVSEVYNVGRYIDEVVRTGSGLRLASRLCVYDSEMVLNSLIYPV